jgi:glycosyltransferase involved in cell wall biosynthesis
VAPREVDRRIGEPVTGSRAFNPWLYEYYRRFTPDISRAETTRIVFLIGSADISGGSYVIFEHALHAKRAGCDVTVVPLFDMADVAPNWHPALQELEFASLEQIASRDFDVAIATWWPTVFELPRVRFRHAIYFVQSAESRFYAIGPDRDSSGLAELTYTFGIPAITIATWLQMYLGFQHRTISFLCRNGIDKTRYGPEGRRMAPRLQDGGLRVLVEGSLAPMKGVAEAVQAARDGGADEVWLLTPSDLTEFPGCDRVVSRIPAAKTSEVYHSCDVLLKLSQVEGMYGPPLEMFHCGGTVITNDVTGSDEFIKDGVNALVVPTGDVAAAAEAVRRLRDSEDLRASLRRGAQRTADGWPDWDESSALFLRIVLGISQQVPADRTDLLARIAGARSLYEQMLHP